MLADTPGPAPFGSQANNLSGVLFDDTAAQPIAGLAAVDTTVPPGPYRPDQPLGSFVGRPASGTWTLTAIDKRVAVTGTLGGWSLISRRFACSNPAGASTGPARGLTARAITVGGEIDAGGVPTSYRVEYGRTAAYGTTSAAADAGDGGRVPVTTTLTGLAPATTYHYRVVALRGGAMVASGADRALTTPRAPAGGPAPRAFVSFATAPKRITLRSRRFALRFTGTPGATGTLAVTGRRVIVMKPFRIAADGRARVAVKLSRRAYRALAKRRLRLRVTATVGAATFTYVVTLKPRQRRH